MNLHFFIPGDINTLTGGYIYDKQMVDGLRFNQHHVIVYTLNTDFPFPSPESKHLCEQIIHSIPQGDILIFDSLVFGSIPDILEKHKSEYLIVGLIHLPLSLNPGFSEEERLKISILEDKAFTYAHLIIATSSFTRNLLIAKGVRLDLINVIIPGVESHMHKKNYNVVPFAFLTISNYTRNKGHLHLINALTMLKQFDWHLDCYGNKNFDPEYVKELSDLIDNNNLSNKIFLHSSISGYELSEAYISSDLLIHPSEFESYGMVLTEALAHGIPVIASTGGATTQTVPGSMGIFFKVNDAISLRDAIKRLLTDTNLYKTICTEASKYISESQSWKRSVKEFENALQNLM